MLFLSARRDGLITDNPAEDVKTVAQRGEKRSRRPFSLDELRSVLSVADDEWRSMILFGLYTGARLSDVASLTWENVDLAARELRFIAKKTGKRIILPLDGPLAAHSETLAAADSPRTPLHPRAFSIVEKQGKTGHLSNQFTDLLAQAGLRKKQPHRKTEDKEAGRCRRNAGHLVPQPATYRCYSFKGSGNPTGGCHGTDRPRQRGNEPALHARRPRRPRGCGSGVS